MVAEWWLLWFSEVMIETGIKINTSLNSVVFFFFFYIFQKDEVLTHQMCHLCLDIFPLWSAFHFNFSINDVSAHKPGAITDWMKGLKGS